jgi:hypothetical protein
MRDQHDDNQAKYVDAANVSSDASEDKKEEAEDNKVVKGNDRPDIDNADKEAKKQGNDSAKGNTAETGKVLGVSTATGPVLTSSPTDIILGVGIATTLSSGSSSNNSKGGNNHSGSGSEGTSSSGSSGTVEGTTPSATEPRLWLMNGMTPTPAPGATMNAGVTGDNQATGVERFGGFPDQLNFFAVLRGSQDHNEQDTDQDSGGSKALEFDSLPVVPDLPSSGESAQPMTLPDADQVLVVTLLMERKAKHTEARLDGDVGRDDVFINLGGDEQSAALAIQQPSPGQQENSATQSTEDRTEETSAWQSYTLGLDDAFQARQMENQARELATQAARSLNGFWLRLGNWMGPNPADAVRTDAGPAADASDSADPSGSGDSGE